MRVLIADKFPDPYIDQIRGLGSQVVYKPTFGAAEIVQNIADKDVVVVRSTKVTAEAIEATRNLSLIIRAGAGTNNIDKQAASAKGVYVSHGINAKRFEAKGLPKRLLAKSGIADLAGNLLTRSQLLVSISHVHGGHDA